MKKGTIITAVTLMGVGCLLFAVALIAFGFDFSKLDTARYETNTYTVTEAFEKINIRTSEADITFQPSTDGKARVVCVERETTKHEVSVQNGTLTVTVVDKRAWYEHMTFSLKPQSVTVYLPSEHYAALLLGTATGNISVSAPFSFGQAEVTASTGNVTFGAAVNEGLKIHTSTGNIRLDGVHANGIDLSVSTGRIEGSSLRCNTAFSVEVSTGNTVLTNVVCQTLSSHGSTGNMTLKNVTAADSFQLERSTGNIRLAGCDAGQLTVRTSTGNVHLDGSDAEQITVKTSTGNVTGTLLTDKVFSTKTSTGRVDVPDTTSGGKCEITTSTGNIRVTVTN